MSAAGLSGQTLPVPWCDKCDRFLSPASLSAEGACPECGEPVSDAGHAHEAEDVSIPWHFWVGVVALALYLFWRAIEGVLLLF